MKRGAAFSLGEGGLLAVGGLYLLLGMGVGAGSVGGLVGMRLGIGGGGVAP